MKQSTTPWLSTTAVAWLPILSLAVASLCAGCGGEREMDDATKHRVAARKALNAGDHEVAMQEFTAAIEIEPTAIALFERAQLHVKAGNDTAAIEDCEAALQLDSENPDIPWYLKELKKPKQQRFRGSGSAPPSNSK